MFPSRIGSLYVVVVILAFLALLSESFVVVPHHGSSKAVVTGRSSQKIVLNMSDQQQKEDDKLRALGYSEDEVRRSRKEPTPDPPSVRVDLVEDVDAATLTAVGFGLIALNFFVFANMGDGGIGGFVASIINTMNQ